MAEVLFAMKYFPFPELYVFLQIVSCCFRNTEIFHGIRNFHSHLFSDSKKVIHCISAGKYYRCVLLDVDLVLTEFSTGYALNFYELMKVQFEIVFLRQLTVWRFF